jgi:NAD(P)H-hydrate epimerase
VVEVLAHAYAPLREQRIIVMCGKGNNGGDGLVVARQLYTRSHPRALHVVLAGDPGEMEGDAAANYRMLEAVGCPVSFELSAEMETATLIVDALLGTGIHGAAKGRALELIRAINDRFPLADVVSVDLPSGLDSDSGVPPGETVHASHTVTFTAPKLCHVLSPACELSGHLHVAAIGSPRELFEQDAAIYLSLSEPGLFAHLFRPRVRDSNKGLYGHALVIGGSRGKSGAAAMAGIGALRAGAGLVTVASTEAALGSIAAHAPEIMTELLAFDDPARARILERKNVVAIGPGLGQDPQTVQFVRGMVEQTPLPMVVDADGLNALAGHPTRYRWPRIFTPHPGEMSRLNGRTIAEIQADRIGTARAFATERDVYLVLKGNRSVVAAPDGRVWINPTGSPAMATGGTGDVLTGLIAGLVAQFPDQIDTALLAAVYLHGRCGELGAAKLGEKSLIATDLFEYLPEAMREVADHSNAI